MSLEDHEFEGSKEDTVMKKHRNPSQEKDLKEIAFLLATGIVRMKTQQMLLSNCPRWINRDRQYYLMLSECLVSRATKQERK